MPQTQEIVDQYDGIIIGSGQGGKPLALALAGAGRKTALVERQLRVHPNQDNGGERAGGLSRPSSGRLRSSGWKD